MTVNYWQQGHQYVAVVLHGNVFSQLTLDNSGWCANFTHLLRSHITCMTWTEQDSNSGHINYRTLYLLNHGRLVFWILSQTHWATFMYHYWPVCAKWKPKRFKCTSDGPFWNLDGETDQYCIDKCLVFPSLGLGSLVFATMTSDTTMVNFNARQLTKKWNGFSVKRWR